MDLSFNTIAIGAVALVMILAFIIWTQALVRYHAAVYAVVTRGLRPGQTLDAWERAELLLPPVRDPLRFADRMTPEGAQHLRNCSQLRSSIWQSGALFALAAMAMWLLR